MTDVQNFINNYYGYCKQIEKETGLSAIAILTQAALESGWGKYAVGNNFFGIKDTDGVNGNEQLITTTEYSGNPNLKFPVIISKVLNPVNKLWKYLVKDYFRKYNTPYDSFKDHTDFFIKNSRYAKAWEVRGDWAKFFHEIAVAGYATAPDYEKQLVSTAKALIPMLPK